MTDKQINKSGIFRKNIRAAAESAQVTVSKLKLPVSESDICAGRKAPDAIRRIPCRPRQPGTAAREHGVAAREHSMAARERSGAAREHSMAARECGAAAQEHGVAARECGTAARECGNSGVRPSPGPLTRPPPGSFPATASQRCFPATASQQYFPKQACQRCSLAQPENGAPGHDLKTALPEHGPPTAPERSLKTLPPGFGRRAKTPFARARNVRPEGPFSMPQNVENPFRASLNPFGACRGPGFSPGNRFRDSRIPASG